MQLENPLPNGPVHKEHGQLRARLPGSRVAIESTAAVYVAIVRSSSLNYIERPLTDQENLIRADGSLTSSQQALVCISWSQLVPHGHHGSLESGWPDLAIAG